MTGSELRELRKAAGLSQEALARDVPCTTDAVSKWETGKRRISPITKVALLAALRRAHRRQKKSPSNTVEGAAGDKSPGS